MIPILTMKLFQKDLKGMFINFLSNCGNQTGPRQMAYFKFNIKI